MNIKTLFILFFIFSSICLAKQFHIPRKVWIYWSDDITKASLIVRLCYQKINTIASTQNWNLTLLNDNNLKDFISNYEELIAIKDKAYFKYLATYADLIRLTILQEHGGIWFDISTALIFGLKWLDNLQKIPYLLTNYGSLDQQGPQVILPYISYRQSSVQHRSSQGFISNQLPGYQVWFIASVKNAKFIKQWRERYIMHYQRSPQQNFIEQQRNQFFLRFIGGDYLNCQKSAYQLMELKQRQLDSNLKLFGRRIHAYEYYKITAIHGQYGPFVGAITLSPIPMIDYVLSKSIKNIKQQFYVPINFFLKFTHSDRPFYEQKIFQIIELSKKYNGNIRQNFDKFISSQPTQKQCSQILFIVQGSAFDLFIQNSTKAKQQNIHSITQQQMERWKNYCKQKHNYTQFIIDRTVVDQINTIVNSIFIDELFSNEFRQKIKMIVQRVISWVSPQGGKMGRYSDAQQVYYWQKINNINQYKSSSQQLYIKSSKNQQSQIKDRKNIQKRQYSINEQIDLLGLQFKLYILSNKLQLVLTLLVSLGFMTLIALFKVIQFIIKLFTILMVFIIKFIIIIINKLKKMLNLPVSNEQLSEIFTFSISQRFNKIKQYILSFNFIKLIQLTRSFIKASIKMLKIVTIVVFLSLFYGFIMIKYEFIIVYGQVFDQQWIFIAIIIVRIVLDKIINNHGSRQSLKGFGLREINYLLKGIYYMFFGCQLLSIVQILRQNNFSLAFILCLCIPLLVNEIQAKLRYFDKRNIKYLPQILRRLLYKSSIKVKLNKIKQLTLKLDKILQRGILIVVIFIILIPNIKHVRFGQDYALKKVIYGLLNVKYLVFGYFVILCLVECYSILKRLYRWYRVKRQTVMQQTQLKQIKNSTEQQLQNNSYAQQYSILKSNQNQDTLYNILILVIKFIYNMVKICLYYEIVFNSRYQFFIKYQMESVNQRIQKGSFTMIVAMVSFITANSYIQHMLTIYIDKIINSKNNPNKINKSDKNSYEVFMNSVNSIQQSSSIEIKNSIKQQTRQWDNNNQYILSYTLKLKLSIMVLMAQIFLFLASQFYMIDSFYSFFQSVQSQNYQFIQKVNQKIVFCLFVMPFLIITGYFLIRQIIKGCIKHKGEMKSQITQKQ